MQLAKPLLTWFAKEGRKTLPWQTPRTPYRVWISEIMLQQTQVNTVIPYFQRFMTRFPDVVSLAKASEDEVFSLWTGLGYYRRARFLWQAAKVLMAEYQGELPKDLNKLMALPGIGRSTAGAILSLGYEQYAPILDGNVKRVLSRFYGIESWPGEPKTESLLWDLASQATPSKQVAAYNQAIMDLGAMVCSRGQPACGRCPLSSHCKAHASGDPSRLPISKPKKTLPVRQGTLAIIQDEQENILLIKRPATGVWSGLWSFPEIAKDVNITSWLREVFACKLNSQEILPSFRHTFTHFHWELQPCLLKVDKLPKWQKTLSQNARWFKRDAWYEVGLPKPVRQLLDELTLCES